MPVVHGRTILEIEASCAAIQAVSPRPRWIGIGGLVPLLKLLGRSGKHPTQRHKNEHFLSIIRSVKQAFPHSIMHVFGAGAPRSCLAAFAMGAHSADSQGWRQAAGFGSIFLPGKGQRILEWNKATRRPRPLVDEEDRHLLAACRCPACIGLGSPDERIQLLKSGFEPRSIHNAWVLYHEVAGIRLALREGRLATFLAGRLPQHWFDIVLSAH
jgi:tRNA-guanine family transglycosylase